MATSAHRALSPVALPVLISRDAIAKRIAEIGTQIDRDYAGESVLLVGVLKGATIFLSDLARAISIQCTFDFVAVSSYGRARAAPLSSSRTSTSRSRTATSSWWKTSLTPASRSRF
jgi:hypoxanthine-guanine phosphoribosyltransferase